MRVSTVSLRKCPIYCALIKTNQEIARKRLTFLADMSDMQNMTPKKVKFWQHLAISGAITLGVYAYQTYWDEYKFLFFTAGSLIIAFLVIKILKKLLAINSGLYWPKILGHLSRYLFG